MSAWSLAWGTSWGDSWGLAAITIPDVTGETLAYATEVLEDAGFTVSVAYAYSPTVRAGLVISQVPAGGETGEDGQTVILLVAINPVAVARVTIENSEAWFQ